MGLDASVFCDCVEKNRLKKPHPYPKQLYISRNGSPEIRSVDSVKIDKHDAWMQLPPCKHADMNAGSSHLGNMEYIHGVRDALASVSSQLPTCPILLDKVLFSGTHTGDILSVRQVRRLAQELERMKSVDLRLAGIPKEQLKSLRSVISELSRLAKTALELKKPIAF